MAALVFLFFPLGEWRNFTFVPFIRAPAFEIKSTLVFQIKSMPIDDNDCITYEIIFVEAIGWQEKFVVVFFDTEILL